MTFLYRLSLLICIVLGSCNYNQASDTAKPNENTTSENHVTEAKIELGKKLPVIEKEENHEKSSKPTETIEINPSLASESDQTNNTIKPIDQAIDDKSESIDREIEASKESLLEQKNEYEYTPEITEEKIKVENTIVKESKEVKPIVEDVVSDQKPVIVKPPIKKPIAKHDSWNTLLSQFVSSSGDVNYSGLKKKEAKLDAYLSALSKEAPTTQWSKKKQLAYWMNAYNAFTVKLILDNYPVSSITNLHGGKPWDHTWINLGGKTYSLNDIEHKIIRPQFKEPRIHFAVVCAAKSCPPLLNMAFTEQNVDQLLDQITKAFINNSVSNTISDKSVQLSKIFEWYGEDFGDLIGFLNKYSNTNIAQDAKVSYKDYDWSLNE